MDSHSCPHPPGTLRDHVPFPCSDIPLPTPPQASPCLGARSSPVPRLWDHLGKLCSGSNLFLGVSPSPHPPPLGAISTPIPVSRKFSLSPRVPNSPGPLPALPCRWPDKRVTWRGRIPQRCLSVIYFLWCACIHTQSRLEEFLGCGRTVSQCPRLAPARGCLGGHGSTHAYQHF